MQEQVTRVDPRVAAARAWALVATLAGLAALLTIRLPTGHIQLPGVIHPAWPLLALLFVIAESCVVHVRFGGDAHSFSLGDIPLVLGLFLATPDQLILARLTGTMASLVWHRRQSIVKLSFNLAQFWLGTVLAIRIFDALGGHAHALSNEGWLAALLAVALTDVLATLSISAMLALRRGHLDASTLITPLWTGLVSSGANTCFALITLDVLRVDWRGAWALVAVAALLGTAQHAYMALHRRHNSLEQLNAFVREVDAALELQRGVSAILRMVRDMLQAHVAAIEITGNSDQTPFGQTPSDQTPSDQTPSDQTLADQTLAYWWDDEGVHVGVPAAAPTPITRLAKRRPWSSPATSGHSALAVTFHVDAHTTGTLSVIGRLGDVGQFGPDDARLLNALAGHAGIALHNGRLVDELREQAAMNAYQANHDALTGLPNRFSFDRALADYLSPDRIAAVLLLDLNRFKEVNDTLGHAVGDQLLSEIGQRLRAAVQDDACVCRFGGDEFAIFLPGADGDEAIRCAEHVQRELAQPLPLRDLVLSADASIGVALAPLHGNDSESLLRHADVAMYTAKSAQRAIEVYSSESDHNTASRLAMVSELKLAIAEDQLRLYYQPTADIRGGAVRGVEALVRWEHPTRGLVPPDDFIPVAEQTGLIGGLTEWVMRTALRQQRAWLDDGVDLTVAINISPRVLEDATFPATLTALLATYHVPTDRLVLEITENAIMANPEHVIEVLEQLRLLGLRLSMDDFGIGHSSMAYLKRLPIDEVKVDKLFVQGMIDDPDDQAIVHAIVQLAHKLGLHVVAEGVETQHCWDMLSQMDVDTVQGFLLSRPIPADQLTAWLRLRRAVALTTPILMPDAGSRLAS